MVKKDLVSARLEKLRLYLKTLKAIRKHDLETFKNDVFIHATAERYLHLSIEEQHYTNAKRYIYLVQQPSPKSTLDSTSLASTSAESLSR